MAHARRLVTATALGLLAHLTCSCGGYQPEVVRTTPAAREEFDPQTLNDDDFLIQPSRAEAAPPAWSPPASPGPPAISGAESAEGFRIQIVAVRDRARAEAFRAEAQQQFEQPVYVHYDEDTRLYKIHVGNAPTASDATRLRQEAKGRGYREAYVVKTRIEVAPVKIRRPEKAPGFRVQIYSASNQQSAEQEQEHARGVLGRDDVYVDFEPPFFKVRVGDFSDRKEAESLLEQVKEQGYETPFLVRTQVIVHPG